MLASAAVEQVRLVMAILAGYVMVVVEDDLTHGKEKGVWL